MSRQQASHGGPIVFFRGVAHEMDDHLCRVALVQRQVDRDFDSMQSLADSLDISRSTATRFFQGRPVSLTVALLILDKLKLRFEDVFRSLGRDESRKTVE